MSDLRLFLLLYKEPEIKEKLPLSTFYEYFISLFLNDFRHHPYVYGVLTCANITAMTTGGLLGVRLWSLPTIHFEDHSSVSPPFDPQSTPLCPAPSKERPPCRKNFAAPKSDLEACLFSTRSSVSSISIYSSVVSVPKTNFYLKSPILFSRCTYCLPSLLLEFRVKWKH
ncbi:hypothetical protein CEXT_350651 [Caerostris extrusa]|uniref:Uncharacterized protein n=1 Tax=Caerostris extrusa TaxID=172846 RepID=A0AAV4X4L5_CAEEX|nr:hypothetical protein CEXT_350651 [Caerostris extrusa]